MNSPTLISTRIVWSITLALAAVAMVLGYIGFGIYVRTQDGFEASQPPDLIYYSIQMFVLGPSPFGGGAINGPLQAARFLAPLATLLALLQTLTVLFGGWATSLAVRWWPRHALVIGDGHAAALLAERLLRDGRTVAVLGGAVPAEDVRGRRMLIVPGEPAAEATLRAAGLRSASTVFAVSSSWVSNAAAALAVSKLAKSGTSVYAHIPDEDVLVKAWRTRPGRTPASAPLADLVSLDAVAARTLLIEHPPGFDGGSPRGVVITGTSPFVLPLLRELVLSQELTRLPRSVTVVTQRAGAMADALAAYGISAHAAAGYAPTLIEPDEFARRRAEWRDATGYVCWADPDRVLRDGLYLRAGGSPKVVLCLRRLAGLGEALNGQQVFDAERMAVFGILDSACEPDRITGDLYDQLARAAHGLYVRRERDDGRPIGGTLVPWEELGQDIRDDNRAVADEIFHFVAQLGAEVVRASVQSAVFGFTPVQIETLARQEHERWMAAKIAAGFVHGDVRGPGTHPDILEWDDLAEWVRDKDRAFISGIPEILAEAGLQIQQRRP